MMREHFQIVTGIELKPYLRQMKFTRHNLKKFETVFNELDYTILYEKGGFQSGYCLVEGENVVVINKFFDIESRINCLIEILDQITMDKRLLSKESQKFLFQVSKLQHSLPSIWDS